MFHCMLQSQHERCGEISMTGEQGSVSSMVIADRPLCLGVAMTKFCAGHSPSSGCFLSNKTVLHTGEKIGASTGCAAFCCHCATAQHKTGCPCTALRTITPRAHLRTSSLWQSPFTGSPYLLFFSSQLFDSCSAQLSTHYLIQLEASSCSCFPNLWVFPISTYFASLFCFSFGSLEPGFFLFLHTCCSCCKHLLIFNLPSETDCLFLHASSIHSLFKSQSKAYIFLPALYLLIFSFVLSALCLNALINSL